MKMKTSLVALVLAMSGLARAGVPTQIDAQGVLRDATGDLVDLPDATLVFRIYDAASQGALLWSETQTVPVLMGVFDTLLPANALTELPTAVQSRLATGAGLWLSLQLEGQDELPRTPLVSVPYAFTANRALVAAALDCTGCIDASQIDTSTFTAQELVYAPIDGALVTATTVASAIGQLDDYLADHIANPDAHHPADSAGIAIHPTSVTVGASHFGDGELDLGPGANDALTAAQVTTLTDGGNADALHKHSAQSISGLPAGGSCYTRWGNGSCPQGFSESNVGTAIYPYLSTSTSSSMGPAICAENVTLGGYGHSGGTWGWGSGGPNPANSGYLNSTAVAIACAVCCPTAAESGSCRNETIYRSGALSDFYQGPRQAYGPVSVGFTGRGYAVSSIEVLLSIGGANSVGAVSAYDLQVTDSVGNVLDTAPLRFARLATTSEHVYPNYYSYYVYRAEVSFALPSNNMINITTLAVSSHQPAPVIVSDPGCTNCGGTNAWMSVTGCATE